MAFANEGLGVSVSRGYFPWGKLLWMLKILPPACVVMFSAHAKGYDRGGTDDLISHSGPNRPPVVDILGVHGVPSGSRTTLQSSAADPDGDAISYRWEQVQGEPRVTLSGADTENASFIAPHVAEDTELAFKLTVTDEHGLAAVAHESIIVRNAPPSADAGTDQKHAPLGSTVTLDGSGSMDPGGGSIVSHFWEQRFGPEVVLSNTAVEQPTFAVPDVHRDTVLSFKLTVADERGLTDEDVVTVIVNRIEPLRRMGPAEATAFLALAVDRNTSNVLVAGSDGAVDIYSGALGTISTGAIERSWYDHETPSSFVAISDWARTVLTGGGDVARWWSTLTGIQVHELRHGANLTALALSWSGALALTGGDDGIARTWSSWTGKQETEFLHGRNLNAVALSGDGTVAVTGGDDGMARVWNASTGDLMHALDHGSSVRAVALSIGFLEFLGGDGIFALTGGDDGMVRVWSTSTGELMRTFRHGGSIRAVALSGDGAIALTGGAEGTVRVWDATTGERLSVLKYYAGTSTNSLALSRDGEYLAFIEDEGGVQGAHLWSVFDAMATLTAFAGGDQAVEPGTVVTLDGSGSHGPANGSLSYSWRQIGGASVGDLAGEETATASFTAPITRYELLFQLTVEGEGGQTDRDLVFVTVTNDAALVGAGREASRIKQTTWRP